MNNRLVKLKDLMHQKKVDAVLISSIPNIIYFTNLSNFSREERESFLLITQNNNYIITDGRYSEAVLNHTSNEKINLPKYSLIEISASSSLKKILTDIGKKIKKLGIEEDNLTVKEHKLLSSCFDKLIDFNTNLLRNIKEPKEIELIEKACKLGDKTFNHILKKIKLGIRELEIAFEIEFFIKKQGADISFYPIVAFGKNSSIPHHQSSHSKLKTNNFILLDFGAKIDNYCSDMTRTIVFGKANDKQKKIYQTVLKAQKRAIEHINNNRSKNTSDGDSPELVEGHGSSEAHSIKASDIDKVARDCIISQGYPTIPHSLGHGTGLEIHESPSLSPKSKDFLKKGMVFSIEPGIYLPGFGGVRIEDLVVLEKKGLKMLTCSSKELIEL